MSRRLWRPTGGRRRRDGRGAEHLESLHRVRGGNQSQRGRGGKENRYTVRLCGDRCRKDDEEDSLTMSDSRR